MANRAPLRPCTAPGCPNRVPAGRCEQHAGLARKRRETWTQLYGPGWPARRLEYLETHPVCDLCHRQAHIPDHYPVTLRELLRRRVTNPHHDRYLRPLCWPCHAKHTGRSSPGGWNALRR